MVAIPSVENGFPRTGWDGRNKVEWARCVVSFTKEAVALFLQINCSFRVSVFLRCDDHSSTQCCPCSL